MSVTCSKPSMPPRSMKAPYSVRFFTTPVTTEPSTRCSRVALLRTLISSSTAVLRETTTLPRRRLSLMILTGMSCPTSESRLWTGRGSAWDPGIKAALHRNIAVGIAELLDGNEAFGLVSEVDDHVLGGDTEYCALQDFVGGGRREMAVIVEKVLVTIGSSILGLP